MALAVVVAFLLGVGSAMGSLNTVLIAGTVFLTGCVILAWRGKVREDWYIWLIICGVFAAAGAYYRCRAMAVQAAIGTAGAVVPSSLRAASGIFGMVLPALPSELMAALIGGSTAGMGSGLKSAMAASGTSYIVGMYGYKIGLLGSSIWHASRRFFSHGMAFAMVVGAIALFVAAAGVPATAVRAGVMTSLIFFAKCAGRRFHAPRTLLFVAAGMLMTDPLLLGTVGFQMSMLSLSGIFFLGPPFRRCLGSERGGDGWLGWRAHAAAAIAVNAAILPLIMTASGGASVTMFLSNFLIAVPFPIVVFLGTLMVALGSISVPLAHAAGIIALPFLSYQLWVISITAALTLPLPGVFRSPPFIVAYYVILIAFAIRYKAGTKEETDAAP